MYTGSNPIRYTDPSGHFFGGFVSFGMSIMSTIVSGYPRVAGTVQRGTALAINAHFIGLGFELRNEAISSIEYLLNNGGSQDEMDAAYKKYYYATQIISSIGELNRLTQSAIGWAQASASFANSLHIPLQGYRAVSRQIGDGLEKIVSMRSRNLINAELRELEELIRASIGMLFRGRGLAN